MELVQLPRRHNCHHWAAIKKLHNIAKKDYEKQKALLCSKLNNSTIQSMKRVKLTLLSEERKKERKNGKTEYTE